MKDMYNLIKKALKHKFIRFFFVGSSAFIIDFSVYKILVIIFNFYPPLETAIANIISVTVAFIYNFTLSRNWTFKANNSKTHTQLIKFLIMNVSNLIISTILVSSFVWIIHHTKLNDLNLSEDNIQSISKGFVVLLMAVPNFTLYRLWVFKDTNN